MPNQIPIPNPIPIPGTPTSVQNPRMRTRFLYILAASFEMPGDCSIVLLTLRCCWCCCWRCWLLLVVCPLNAFHLTLFFGADTRFFRWSSRKSWGYPGVVCTRRSNCRIFLSLCTHICVIFALVLFSVSDIKRQSVPPPHLTRLFFSPLSARHFISTISVSLHPTWGFYGGTGVGRGGGSSCPSVGLTFEMVIDAHFKWSMCVLVCVCGS